MEAARQMRRNARKIKDEPPFELVAIKDDPDGDISLTLIQEDSPDRNSGASSKRKYLRSRAVQVKSEDIDVSVPTVPGENEPINPVVGESTVAQCRFCLRRVLRSNLKIILTKHKQKAHAAFKIKIFPGDAYPFACCNCLNLLDIMLDFKEAVMKAKNLLLSERAFLESEGWDDTDCMDAISKCRSVVEQHKNQIDCSYQEYTRRKQAEETKKETMEIVEPPNPADVNSDGLDTPITLEHSAEYVSINKSELDICDTLETGLEAEPDILLADDAEDKDANSDLLSATESEEEDFVQLKKVKRSRKSKVKSAKQSKSAGKASSSTQELCDLCGQRVCAQAAESHKNRHLGIKPYSCPAEGCDLTFYSRFNQTLHVRRIHRENGVPSHKCDICGRYIRGALGVLNYHKRKHQQTKKHECQFCGKGFTMMQYLKQHLTVVHSEVFPYECSYCGKKFKLKWSMITHEKNVHEKKHQAALAQEQTDTNCTITGDTGYEYV
ncbi:zinc finger protein 649-like isoform X2 [Sabethes cyaneus]|uniref:zinc finger protein 649-like isoform X2 n=1 Tax=Sabethes cyaneus TaxID=53552 RepID=UPI00237D4132|nr:zinc finger protein 649-like isoform X2 [Sabethes cyaneus]